MTGFEIRIRGGSFSKRIAFGESGHDLSVLRQIAQNAEVLFVNVDAKHDKLLFRKFRTQRGGEHARYSEQTLLVYSGAANAGQHANTTGLEDATTFGKRTIADEIVNYVVTLIAFGEIFFRIIDHVIGA